MILPLVTQRLSLRDFSPSDIPRMIEIVTHPGFTGYRRFRPGHLSEDVTAYIEEAIDKAKPDTTGQREIFRLAVCLKAAQNKVIGCCIFHGWNAISKDHNQIGFFFDPDYQGHGYATEATGTLIHAYFSRYPDRQVYATTHPLNVASQKVLEKLGFLQSGTKTLDNNGTQEPRLVYFLAAHHLKKPYL